MTDILISGYYGFGNSGDDALLLAIIQDLKRYKKNINLAVLSRTPHETAEIYGIKTVNRMNPFSVFYNIMRCKMLVSGGGTLIQDGTSTKSLLYYLAIIKTAHFFRKKIMLYSNGIGPLMEEHREITKQVLNKADVITLRDPASLEELKSLGVDKPKTELTADPAFNLECRNTQAGEKILEELGLSKNDKIACISVRKWKNCSDSFADEVAAAVDYLSSEYGFKILFMPMQKAKDSEISHKIMKKMENESVCLEKHIETLEMISVVSLCSLCIGMRLHSLIYAINCCVPVIGLVYDPKIAGFMDYMGQKFYLDASDIKARQLMEMMDECCGDIDKIKKDIAKNLSELKSKALKNAELAVDLLESRERRRLR